MIWWTKDVMLSKVSTQYNLLIYLSILGCIMQFRYYYNNRSYLLKFNGKQLLFSVKADHTIFLNLTLIQSMFMEEILPEYRFEYWKLLYYYKLKSFTSHVIPIYRCVVFITIDHIAVISAMPLNNSRLINEGSKQAFWIIFFSLMLLA